MEKVESSAESEEDIKEGQVSKPNPHQHRIAAAHARFWHETSRYGVIHYAEGKKSDRAPCGCLIVYVHGIFGDAEITWGEMPQWVLENCGLDVDVISFAYPSGIWRRTSLAQAANHLKTWLNTEFSSYRHMIFVTHSTGGLVVKHLLDQEFQAISHQVAGHQFDFSTSSSLWIRIRRVINIAVPHLGGSPILTTLSSALYYPAYSIAVPFLYGLRFLNQGKNDWGRNQIIPALRWKNRWLLELDAGFTKSLLQSVAIGLPTPTVDDICAESDQSVPTSKQASRRTIHLRGTHKSVKIPNRSTGPIVEIVADILRRYPQDISLSIADRTLARLDQVNKAAGIKSLLKAASGASFDCDEKPVVAAASRFFGSQEEICDRVLTALASVNDRPGQMLVTGTGGVGKSAVMRMIAWRLGCGYLRDPDVNPLPLFLPLQQASALNESDTRYSWETMWAWWLQWIATLYPNETCTFEWLEQQFHNRPTAIIVDGLDDFLVNNSTIGLSTIVNILRDAAKRYANNNKLSILVSVRNDVHGLDRLVYDPAAIFEILPLSRPQALELFPHTKEWLASLRDMDALDQILTPLVLTHYQPPADERLRLGQLTETSIKNEIVDTFLRRSNLVGIRTQQGMDVELNHLRISLSIIAWLFFCKSRGEISAESVCEEAGNIREKWQVFFPATSSSDEFLVGCYLLESADTCKILLKRSVFVATGPKTRRFLHRTWQELLLARFLNYSIHHNYYNEIGKAKLYAAIYRMAGDMRPNANIGEEQVNSVLEAWRETKNSYITSNFIGFLAWTITPIDAQALRLLLEELENFEALTRIILIGGLGYRIIVDDENDHARGDMRRALIPKLAELSDLNASPLDDSVACSLAWCYQKAFGKLFGTRQPKTAWPELDFGDRPTFTALRMLGLVVDERLALDSRSRSLQQALLRSILDTYKHPKFVVRAVHYLYYLVAAELHTVHDSEVSMELPLFLATGGEFEQIVESFNLVPEVLKLYRRCQRAHDRPESQHP